MSNEQTAAAEEVQEYIQMGQALAGHENYAEAHEAFDKALKLDPMNKIAYMSKGVCYSLEENFTEAKECYTRALKIDREFADAYFQLGNIAFIEEAFEDGMKYYNQAVSFGYQSPELFYNLGLAYEEQDDPERAMRYYAKAEKLDDMNPVYSIRRASLQIILGKYEEALQTLEHVRAIAPDSFDGYHLTAAVYSIREEYDKAESILLHALSMFDSDVDLYMDLIRVYISDEKTDKALELIAKIKNSEDLQPGDRKELLSDEAQIYGTLEKTDEAIASFLEALEIPENPEADPEIRYLLINMYMLKKENQKAFDLAKKMDPEDTDNAYSMTGVYLAAFLKKAMADDSWKEDMENGIRYYRSISMKDPSRVDAYLFRAMCYRELERFDKALESIDYVMLLQPDNPHLHLIKGNILKEMPGREQEAEQEYAQARKGGKTVNSLLNILGV